MRHFVVATGIGLLVGAVVAIFFSTTDLTPARASWEAGELDSLFHTYLAIAGVVFGLVVGFLAYSILVFRRRDPDEHGAAFRGHPLVERAWLVVTILLVLASAADAIFVVNKLFSPRVGYAQSELEVKVTAMQWRWLFDYPEFGVQSSELVLEANRPVRFRLISNDVIHSMYVPEFRVKFAAMPGMETELRVVPTVVGEYKLTCAELCGLAHTAMAAPVKVVDSSGFQQWVAAQKK